jgi:hypothetical protein
MHVVHDTTYDTPIVSSLRRDLVGTRHATWHALEERLALVQLLNSDRVNMRMKKFNKNHVLPPYWIREQIT